MANKRTLSWYHLRQLDISRSPLCNDELKSTEHLQLQHFVNGFLEQYEVDYHFVGKITLGQIWGYENPYKINEKKTHPQKVMVWREQLPLFGT